MPPEISEKEAKKAAALARARQYRDELRASKSPTKTARMESGASTPSPKKLSRKSPAPKHAAIRTNAAATKEAAEEARYRKTPSRDDRNKARARARASAQRWSQQRNKKEGPGAEVYGAEVPSVVETVESNSAEVEGLSVGDDFKTAHVAEFQTPAGKAMDSHDLRELNLIKRDVGILYHRVENFHDKQSGTVVAKDDVMDCD